MTKYPRYLSQSEEYLQQTWSWTSRINLALRIDVFEVL